MLSGFEQFPAGVREQTNSSKTTKTTKAGNTLVVKGNAKEQESVTK